MNNPSVSSNSRGEKLNPFRDWVQHKHQFINLFFQESPSASCDGFLFNSGMDGRMDCSTLADNDIADYEKSQR